MSTTPKPTVEQKAHLNQKIRQNIRQYIELYVAPRTKNMAERNDPYFFVEQMNEIWANYQRFVFAHDFIVDKLKQFFETFYKMGAAKNFERDGEVVGVPVIGVNQLKKYFTDKKYNIVESFPKKFSNFIAKERQGTSVPRQMVKESMSAIQSCYFDFEAMVVLDANRKPLIVKNPRGTQNLARRSSDSKYFEEYIIKEVMSDCERFYQKLVNEKSPILTPTDEIDLMVKIISEEESRSVFYIHTPQNQRKYIQTVNRVLIGLDLHSRIHKEDGLIKYLREYQTNKPQYKTELTKFWKVYSRILPSSLPEIVKIYSNYLDEEAVLAEQKIQKFMDFIPEMIRINTKNMEVVQFFGTNFELQNKRNQKIRGMLSNEIIKASKFKGKHTMGATNLAQFINVKFKQIYGKGFEGNEDIITSLTLLFKILQEKVHFTKQHQKHIANRLLEDVDFSKDNQYTTIINLEKKFIEEMQKQMGVSEVKQLLQNIKDIEKSVDHTKKLKEKLGPQIHILNQIVVKNNTFWPEKNTYDISPPTVLLKVANQVEAYFNKTSNIQFEYNNGVSLFRGEFKSKVPKQNFHLKNIYLIILFILDESDGKKMFYGDLKSRIKSYGTKKEKGNLELARNVIELLHIGLLVSSTRVLSKEDPKCIKLNESDQFELNREFDYEEQLKKNKVPPKMIKKLPVIKTSNITMTPDWLKKMFVQESNQLVEDEANIEKGRRVRVKQIAVKSLKHAHHSNKDVTFEQLFAEYSIPKNKQFKVTEKYLKEVLEELINDDYCQRVQGQRNLFKYKA